MPASAPKSAAPPSPDETITQVPVLSIAPDAKNPRDQVRTKEQQAEFAALVKSVQANGVLQPLRLYGNGEEGLGIIYGHRRLAAAIAAGLEHVPAVVLTQRPDEAAMQAMRWDENAQRLNLNPLEKAEAIEQRVAAFGGDIAKAAAAMGWTIKQVRDQLYLQRLAPKVRSLVSAGRITPGQARELAKVGDAEVQFDIAERIQVTYESRGERVYTIEEVRAMVEIHKHSLRVVPWLPDEAFAGKRACSGCADNTATDLELFDTGKEEAEKGCCMNPVCFEAKVRAATKAQKEATTKIEKQLKAKSIDKDQAAAAAREITPAFMKPESVQRAVKRDLGLGDAKPKKTVGGKPEEPKNPYQKPLLAWARAFVKWQVGVQSAIARVAADSPGAAMLALLINLSPRFVADFQLPREWNFDSSPWKTAKAPTLEKPLGPAAAALLEPAVANSSAGLAALADTLDKHDRTVDLHGAGPELTCSIARCFRIEPPPPPAWEDFSPDQPASKSAAAPPAAPRKGGRRKKAGG